MALPLAYNVRNAWERRRTTVLAVAGVTAVVAVAAVLMAMSEGFATALKSTGRQGNAIVVQRGSTSELTSSIPLRHRNLIVADGRVARGAGGRPLASWESVRMMKLPGGPGRRRTSVTLRGVTPQAFEVRGGIRVLSGRRFEPGLLEVIVGRRIAARVPGLERGGTVRHLRKEFTIVGVFESDGGAFESEVWGDFDTIGALYDRGTAANSLVLRMTDEGKIPALDQWIRNQPGMALRATPERAYYAGQAGPVVAVLRALAVLVAAIMGAGAVFGAMNHMYAVVAARTREIGTLRALGFSRRAILLSLVTESAVLALAGGILGCALAYTMHGYSASTSTVQSLTEIAFAFRITPAIVGWSLAFAVAMGVAGGLLPALRASRLPIAAAVREG